MNIRQIILVLIMFFLAMLILSFPLWAEWALPLLKKYMQSAVEMVNDLIELLERARKMAGI